MKRIISLLLILIMFLTPCINSSAGTNDTQPATSAVKANMLKYIQDRNSNLLLTRDNYRYMSFIEEFNSNALDLYLIQMSDFLINTGYEPDMMKYIEVLVNIIATYELDNASDMAEQCKMDNLKTFKDYAMDTAEMAANAVGVISGNSSSSSALEEGISLAVSGLSCLIENTDNWIEAISNLEVIIQNYSDYDAFLAVIEENAEGDLKKAANTLRNSMERAMLIKLETYNEVSDTNYENYKEFFFEDVFFTALKQFPEYSKDEAFRLFVDTGDKIITIKTTLESAWNLGEQIGTMVGNVVVGAENLINRVLEMMAIYEISVILQDEVYDLEVEFLNKYEENVPLSVVDSYILYSQYLIGCRIRGEYCLYSVIANDAGLLSWANHKSAAEAKEKYDYTVDVLLMIQKKLLEIKNEEQIALDDYMDNFELMVKEVGGEFYSETGDHENWVVKDEDLQYGNYIDSDRVDELWFTSEFYSLYGIYVGQELSDTKEILQGNNWIIYEERADIGVIEFQKERTNMTVSFQNNYVTMISFWRTYDESYMSGNNVSEGYYTMEPGSFNGYGIDRCEISVIEDENNISNLNLAFIDSEGYEKHKFIWNTQTEKYEHVDGPEVLDLITNQVEESLKITFCSINNDNIQLELKKEAYVNQANLTLAVKNYFKTKSDFSNYKFDSSALDNILYGEQFMIPVYKGNEKYLVIIGDYGDATMYLADEYNKRIENNLSMSGMEEFESFNAFDYLESN